MIRRRTRGGMIALDDPPAGAIVTCGTCGSIRDGAARGQDRDGALDAVIVLQVQTAAGPTLDTALCADCLSEAIAILYGRRHVQRGGRIEDLVGHPMDLDPYSPQ
jgi:hypothetical protein